MDFRLTDEQDAAAAERPRVRRDRDPSARPRVGRGAALSVEVDAVAGRARADGHPDPRAVRRRRACRPSTTASASRSWRASIPARPVGRRAQRALLGAHLHVRRPRRRSRRYLVPLARGEKIGAWGLTESTSGSDAAAHADHGDARRDVLGAERLEDVHDARPRRRRHGRDGRHRSRRRARRAFRHSSSSTARPG